MPTAQHRPRFDGVHPLIASDGPRLSCEKRSAATLSRRYQAKFDWHQQISPGHAQGFDSYLEAGWQCGETRNDMGTRVRRSQFGGKDGDGQI